MAYYLDDNEIQEYLQEGFEEYGTIEKVVKYPDGVVLCTGDNSCYRD